MSIIGTSVTQSVAGLSQAERAEARQKRPERSAGAPRNVRRDEADTVTVQAETADAVRNLAGNDQEDAREDRQEHPGYSDSEAAADQRPHLDIEG